MKVEQLIINYLMLHKKVGIQSIGHFIYEEVVSASSETDQHVLTEKNISFVCNKNELIDEGFIAYFIQETGKIKPLATSDLESFSILGQQFLNIGKPMVFRGLGYLTKHQSGEYEFTQGEIMPERTERIGENKQVQQTEENRDNSNKIDFSTFKKKKGPSKKWIPITIIVILIGLMGLVVYIFSRYEKKNNEKPLKIESQEKGKVVVNSQPKAKPVVIEKIDSAANLNKDSMLLPHSNGFFVVVRSYGDLESAQRGFNRLQVLPFGKEVKMITVDSSHYQIAVPVSGNITDSSRIRDSVKAIFGKTAFVRIQ